MKIAVIIGTRPEAIKMAPVILELKKREVAHVVIATAQHRELLDQPLSLFGIIPDIDFNIMQRDQDLFSVTTSVLNELKPILLTEKPDIVLVQGDTTTTFAASLAAFYSGIPVAHVEAGLRTRTLSNPFPEELNRQITSRIASLHFAPTEWAKNNLIFEGIKQESITVTGNTIIDALLMMTEQPIQLTNASLQRIDFHRNRVLLLTAHRRENFGAPMREIFQACRELVERYADVEIIYPVHPNPNVQQPAQELLGNSSRIHLIEPLEYRQFLELMKRCYFIMTDSGGVQEEAPAFAKPVLVLRRTTERPEVIESGNAKLVGTDKETIRKEAHTLLTNTEQYSVMARKAHPFGDGHAAQMIVNNIIEFCRSK